MRCSLREIRLIGVASGLGARDPGCADGPGALQAADLAGRLQSLGCRVVGQETLRPEAPEPEDAFYSISRLCARLEEEVKVAVGSGCLPVVLGGDHSCAIGTWRGVQAAFKKPLGLLWIDAHLDSHTAQTSPSGAVHGMPLACLLGHGDPRLVGSRAASLLPQHVCVIGARSFEPEEAALLLRLGVRVYVMEEIRRRGLLAVLREALGRVQEDTAAFGMTLDLDALDPRDAPGVSTPEPEGLHASELIQAFQDLGCPASLAALEIAEFNPHRDPSGATQRLVLELLGALLAPGQSARPSAMELERRYSAHNYDPLPVVLVKGEGAYLWDQKGRRYIDMLSAYSAVSHGHCHPRLVSVLSAQARTLAIASRAFYNERLPAFLARLCQVFGMDRALPVNTGLEAVETALKAARKWAYQVKGVPRDQAEIIACQGNFHGRSIAILALSSEPQYREGFGPYPPGFKLVPYGDAQALEEAITPHTAAFLVEPIQGEGGIIVPPEGYLAACAEICRRHDVLLICDEVQTGLGRTGRLLACQHEGVKPDGLILGKALGGGLLPVSAFLAREDVMAVFNPGDHGSTFGGNPLASAIGLEALDLVLEEDFAGRAQNLGEYFMGELKAIRSPLVREVRGKGLLIGVEIDPRRARAPAVVEELLAHGVLSKDTHHTVVRFAPPLVITRAQIDEALKAIREVFRKLSNGMREAA